MEALEILKAWLKYTDYDPDRKSFYLGSVESSYHSCNKTISQFMPYNPTGEIAVLYAKQQFQKIMADKRVNAFDVISKPELLNTHIDMWKLLSSDDVTVIERTVLDDINSLLEQVVPAKMLGVRDLDGEYRALMGAITAVVEALHKCNVELFLRGGPIGRISNFSTHIHVFNQLAECLLALENSPDGMYLCYLKDFNSPDGYFGFFLKSNGTILSINERINEEYPGEHKKHRNNRYTEAKQYDLFPYDFIFSYDQGGYDYKGYAKSHVIDEEKLAFFQLTPSAYLPLVIAMTLLRNKYTNSDLKDLPIMYVDSLQPVNARFPIPGTQALIVPDNSMIATLNRELEIPISTDDIIHGTRGDLLPQRPPRIYDDTLEPHLNYKKQEENIFIEKYGEGFEIDPAQLLESNRHLKRIGGPKLSVSATPNAEFVGSAERMVKIAYMNGRRQLAEFIRDKMFQEYLSVGGGPGIKKWWNQILPSAKNKVLALCVERYLSGDNATPIGQERYTIQMDLDAKERPYHGRVDPYPFNSWSVYRASGNVNLSNPLCCITGQKASHYFFFRIDTYEQLCALVGGEQVPDILVGYKRAGHRIFGNDNIQATDPMTGLGTPFEDEEYRHNRRLWSKDTWENYYLHHPEERIPDKPFWESVPEGALTYHSTVDFGFAIALSKRGLAKLLKGEL